jgi:hypothetical protein
MDGHPAQNKQSISKLGIITLRIVLRREIYQLFGVLPTKMIAEFLTKPLQGKVFQKFRYVLMGAVPKWYEID